jgi:hypothetical protein
MIQLLGFLVGDGISWSNHPVGAGDSVGSCLVGAGYPLSCYLVGAGCSLLRCPVGAGCSPSKYEHEGIDINHCFLQVKS